MTTANAGEAPPKKHGGARPGAGRKATGRMTEGRKINLTPQEWERADREKERQGISQSELFRRALNAYLRQDLRAGTATASTSPSSTASSALK